MRDAPFGETMASMSQPEVHASSLDKPIVRITAVRVTSTRVLVRRELPPRCAHWAGTTSLRSELGGVAVGNRRGRRLIARVAERVSTNTKEYRRRRF
jgi:hypothetical protein